LGQPTAFLNPLSDNCIRGGMHGMREGIIEGKVRRGNGIKKMCNGLRREGKMKRDWRQMKK